MSRFCYILYPFTKLNRTQSRNVKRSKGRHFCSKFKCVVTKYFYIHILIYLKHKRKKNVANNIIIANFFSTFQNKCGEKKQF